MAKKTTPAPHGAGEKTRIGLIFGGRSGEHEVSIASALSVYQALDKSRYDVTLIAIDKEGQWFLPDSKKLLAQANDPMFVKLARDHESLALVPYSTTQQLVPTESHSKSGAESLPQFDVMLPILHGTYGEDGTIQGLLELAQIPYVGSGVLGSAVGMDKDMARRLLSLAGIQTVPTIVIRKNEYISNSSTWHAEILNKFSFPFFVKPANAGSSVGVHKVKSAEQLPAALKDAFLFDRKVLIEMGIAARELECSVLGNDNPRASCVGEVVPSHEFYSYEAKYLDENGAELQAPAKNLPEKTVQQIQAWAVLAFQVLECRGLARVDFFLDKSTNELYLNEINTMPGFTSISMYPRMWEASGLPYAKLLDELIRLAQENYAEQKSLKVTYDLPPPDRR